jgi:hypothetical protein
MFDCLKSSVAGLNDVAELFLSARPSVQEAFLALARFFQLRSWKTYLAELLANYCFLRFLDQTASAAPSRGERVADWRASSQGLVAVRDFGSANDRIGSMLLKKSQIAGANFPA